MTWKKHKPSLIVLLSFFFGACGVYSFTGSSISPDVKTISIQTFFSQAPLGPSSMSLVFTEKMKDYFQQNTGLAIVDNEGDLQYDGYISHYTVTPVAANASNNSQTQDFSELSRITITISASYVNVKDPTFDFDKTFSFFKDFDNSQDLSSIEEELTAEIFDQIILDIFNSSVANW